MLDVYNTNPSH